MRGMVLLFAQHSKSKQVKAWSRWLAVNGAGLVWRLPQTGGLHPPTSAQTSNGAHCSKLQALVRAGAVQLAAAKPERSAAQHGQRSTRRRRNSGHDLCAASNQFINWLHPLHFICITSKASRQQGAVSCNSKGSDLVQLSEKELSILAGLQLETTHWAWIVSCQRLSATGACCKKVACSATCDERRATDLPSICARCPAN